MVTGIVSHYLIPHSRKENPYLCFTEPCLKSNEYDVFEVTGWFVCVIVDFLLVFLFVFFFSCTENNFSRENPSSNSISGEKRFLSLRIFAWFES